ncbi:hypothetical protein, partial [Hahella sp. HN01]|uniref:hypothetical protein n=1 Tax=Hahella sp. HN01 TaxID=2847262 RepID=UPI0035300DF3
MGLNSADTMKSYQDIDYGLLFNISGEIQIREEGVWKQNMEGVTQHPDNRYRIMMKDGRVHYYVRPAGQSEYQEAYVSERLPEADKAYFVDTSFHDAGAEIRNVALTPEGVKTRYVYDVKGQVRFTLDVLGQVTETRYDSLGLVTEKLSYSHAYTGGVFTESALQTFANGATPASHSRLVYDAKNQVRFTVDALGQVSETRYDALGRVIETRIYDGAYTGSNASEIDLQSFISGKPSHSQSRVVYDAKGQARFTIDALGYVTENRYDALGQVAEKLSYDRAYAGPDYSEAALTQFASAQSQPRSGRLVYDA